MKGISFSTVIGVVILLSGCASSNISSAVKAYAITAEEQATVMQLNLDNCLKASDQASKEAACNAVRSSIEVYRQSAAQLKTIKTTD